MIDLACGVVRISNNVIAEIFDQQGNLNLTPLVVISMYQEENETCYNKCVETFP